MRLWPLLLVPTVLAGCTAPEKQAQPAAQPTEARKATSSEMLDHLANRYVQLSLEIGERETGYIDAYYGPAKWQEDAKSSERNLVQLGNAVTLLEEQLANIPVETLADDEKRRAHFLRAQLNAAHTRLIMMQGETLSFREESLGLFGATPELKPLASYDGILANIEKMVPGDGSLDVRVTEFLDRYVIPKERLKPVFDAAIAECRARTARYIELPEGEKFTMEFVTDKPWSGYNYYQGGYESLIQINTDLPIRISRAVDLGCHEGYPGHHALNMLLEARQAKAKGWQEFSVYPLYSPQSLIAEGSANYGIDLAFPGEERLKFERDILYPLAGLDPATARAYFNLTNAMGALSGARFTIAQQYLDGEIDREKAVKLIRKYQLVSEKRARQSLDFNDTYRSYVINYGLGKDMVRAYIENAGNDPLFRWAAMERIISEPALPANLVGE